VKLVATLVVRDEADIVGAQIAYHLNAGVDFVIATDHESSDGTTEILEAYAHEGFLARIPETGPVREEVWRTRMARLAATEHSADWVINTDADEFWWPRVGTLKELFDAVPRRFGAVGVLNRHFAPAPADDRPFFERMTIRVSSPAAINDPTSPWRPGAKVAHRADANVTVFHAGHAVAGKGLAAVPGWYPLDNLHFPYRDIEQWLRKTTRRAYGDKSLGVYVRGNIAYEEARVEEVFSSVALDATTMAGGLAGGTLVQDRRLRDVLRKLVDRRPGSGTAFRCPDSNDGAVDALAPSGLHDGAVTDGMALQDATLVRLQRRMDAVALGAAALEDRRRATRS
jgi:Glycosyl transferase family 2